MLTMGLYDGAWVGTARTADIWSVLIEESGKVELKFV